MLEKTACFVRLFQNALSSSFLGFFGLVSTGFTDLKANMLELFAMGRYLYSWPCDMRSVGGQIKDCSLATRVIKCWITLAQAKKLEEKSDSECQNYIFN